MRPPTRRSFLLYERKGQTGDLDPPGSQRMRGPSQPDRFGARVCIALVAGCVFAAIGVSPSKGQTSTKGEAYITQVGSMDQTEVGSTSMNSLDRRVSALWPQLSCVGLGLTSAQCLLTSSGPQARSGGNAATVVQRGSDNSAAILQRGGANVVQASQYGGDNVLEAIQVGSGHLLGVRLKGDENSVEVQQRGEGNRYLLSFEGDGLDHSVRQAGTELRLIQIGQGGRPFDVEQRGSDMTIRIEHDPLTVWP